MALDLSRISQKEFTSAVSRAIPTGISQADVQGVWSTISTVLSRASPHQTPLFIANAQSITPAGRAPSTLVFDYLSSLTQVAHEAATSLLCSSILAGQGSESDEFSDFGIYLGSLPGDHELGRACLALHMLGLEPWLDNSEIRLMENTSPVFPSSLRTLSPRQLAGSKPVIDTIVNMLSDMTDKFQFTVVTSSDGGLVLHFLLGRLGAEWIGLGAASTWADEGF